MEAIQTVEGGAWSRERERECHFPHGAGLQRHSISSALTLGVVNWIGSDAIIDGGKMLSHLQNSIKSSSVEEISSQEPQSAVSISRSMQHATCIAGELPWKVRRIREQFGLVGPYHAVLHKLTNLQQTASTLIEGVLKLYSKQINRYGHGHET